MKPQVKQKPSHRPPLLRIAAAVAVTNTQILVPNNNSVTVLKWFEAIC
jgi:hypothetical protein